MNQLHNALTATGIPITGISIGRKDDRLTWRIDFAPDATDEQKSQAAQIVAAFDVAAVEAEEAILLARMEADAAEEQQAKIDAQIQADLNMTPAEVNSTVDTLFAGFTGPQRTFLKRLVRMVLAEARKVLR